MPESRLVAGVLVLAGPPCSGKSTVGDVLASDPTRDGQICIEVDALFSLLMPGSDRNRDDRMLAYDAAHGLARTLVDRGKTVILECTYARLEQRASLREVLADIPAAPLWVVEFVVSPEEAVQRFRRRHQATDLDDELVRERVEHFPHFDLALRLMSSAGTPTDLAGQITTWLGHRPEPIERDRWVEAGRGWA